MQITPTATEAEPKAVNAPRRAYTNSTHTKAQTVALMREHKRLDHIVQGLYTSGEGANFKGCLVGCATGGDHLLFEPAFGIPWQLAWLADDIFEGLAPADAANFAVDFFERIEEGADLSRVYDAWCAWMLGHPVDGLCAISIEPSVKAMADLFAKAATGNEPSAKEWNDASDAAWAAWAARDAWAAWAAWAARDAWAARAAWAARDARDARAAWAARDSRDARAARAAWAARDARAARAARDARAAKQRDALLLLVAGKGIDLKPLPAASESTP